MQSCPNFLVFQMRVGVFYYVRVLCSESYLVFVIRVWLMVFYLLLAQINAGYKRKSVNIYRTVLRILWCEVFSLRATLLQKLGQEFFPVEEKCNIFELKEKLSKNVDLLFCTQFRNHWHKAQINREIRCVCNEAILRLLILKCRKVQHCSFWSKLKSSVLSLKIASLQAV